MENNTTVNEQQNLDTAAIAAEEAAAVQEAAAQQPQQDYIAERSELENLREAFTEARIKLALLLAGVRKDKLEDGAKLAQMYCKAGLTPEDAVDKIVKDYPQLKLADRELPKFSAESGGSDDGFAAIRSIFAKR